MMQKHVIFKGLSPYKNRPGEEGSHRLSQYDEWVYVNREIYRIRKFFLENENPLVAGKRVSTLFNIHNVYAESLKKDALRESLLRARAPEILDLDAIPLGVTEDDKLICLEYSNVKPSIFICGQNGLGKTIFAHRLVDYFYHLFNYNEIIMNDYKIENKYWSRANQYSDNKLLNEVSVGLPIIMLSPTIRGRIELTENIPKMDISIGWDDFIDRIDTFSSLGGSEKYFDNIKSILHNVNDFGEFADELGKVMPDKSDRAMRNKIIAEFGKYMEMRLLKTKEQERDRKNEYFGYTNLCAFQDEKLILGDMPMITLARLGIIPSINTSDLSTNEQAYNRVMKFWIDKIVHKKNVDRAFREEPLILYIDELSKFCSIKKKSASIASVKDLVQRGRHLNLGCILVTQNPDQIDQDIVTNCKYQILFGLPSDKDVTLMGRNLSLDKVHRKQLKGLQKFEALLISTEKEFLIYDLKDNHWYRQNGVYKVHTFLSLGEHEQESVVSESRQSNNEARGRWTGYANKILDEKKIKLCQGKDYMAILDPLYDRRRQNENAGYVDQDKLFTKPKLIEGLSLASFFYDISTNLVTISYQELIDKGFVIISNRSGCYEIKTLDKAKQERGMIVHSSLPKDIMFIAYDPEVKTARLFGRYVQTLKGTSIGNILEH